ncbi:MAG: hypothetical protein KGR98_01305 [Verrucomicrobia bacterium]|nr:hypothetical protein [Verrucomicrobiota bacterium]MDE3098668.1 hypothetical protein [Verrucomicrobiota bacterium]
MRPPSFAKANYGEAGPPSFIGANYGEAGPPSFIGANYGGAGPPSFIGANYGEAGKDLVVRRLQTHEGYARPMAQDFYAEFHPGSNNKQIAIVDENGIALAAIQGLNDKLKERGSEIQSPKQSLAALQKEVSQLKERASR